MCVQLLLFSNVIKDGIDFILSSFYSFWYVFERRKKSILFLLPVLSIPDYLLSLEIFMAKFIKFILPSMKRQTQTPYLDYITLHNKIKKQCI